MFISTVITPLFAQENEEAIEVYLIESFIPPEHPKEFHLGFSTSAVCKSKVILQGSKEVTIADTLTDFHKLVIDISGIKADSVFSCVIITESASGEKYTGEPFDVEKPQELKQEEGSSGLYSCLTGGLVYLVPIIDYNIAGKESHWGFSKELPIVSYFEGGFNYPKHFVSVEYSHIPNWEPKNTFRVGWKYLYQVAIGKYVTGGISLATNFKGFNGISPEVSWGIFTFHDVFTVALRYRFTTDFKSGGNTYSTFSLGLASWFFSVQQ
jgi:hypothetical protein